MCQKARIGQTGALDDFGDDPPVAPDPAQSAALFPFSLDVQAAASPPPEPNPHSTPGPLQSLKPQSSTCEGRNQSENPPLGATAEFAAPDVHACSIACVLPYPEPNVVSFGCT